MEPFIKIADGWCLMFDIVPNTLYQVGSCLLSEVNYGPRGPRVPYVSCFLCVLSALIFFRATFLRASTFLIVSNFCKQEVE